MDDVSIDSLVCGNGVEPLRKQEDKYTEPRVRMNK